jgi:hypothetical protein
MACTYGSGPTSYHDIRLCVRRLWVLTNLTSTSFPPPYLRLRLRLRLFTTSPTTLRTTTPMLSFAAVTLAALLGSVHAKPHQDLSLGPTNAKCVRSTYSIPVTSTNVQFSNYTAPAGVDNTTFVTALMQRFVTDLPNMHNIMHELEAGNGTHPKLAPVSDTYQLSGVLCTPMNNKAPDTVQFLLHGSK